MDRLELKAELDRATLEHLRERFRAWCLKHHRNGKRASLSQQETYLWHLDKSLTLAQIQGIRAAAPQEWVRSGRIPHWQQLYQKDFEASLDDRWVQFSPHGTSHSLLQDRRPSLGQGPCDR